MHKHTSCGSRKYIYESQEGLVEIPRGRDQKNEPKIKFQEGFGREEVKPKIYLWKGHGNI